MANISFSRGEASIKAAEAADAGGDATEAAKQRNLAKMYFGYTRNLASGGDLVTNTAAGISKDDVWDRKDDLMHSYFLEKDYVRMQQVAGDMQQGSAAGSVEWMLGKDYQGIGLTVMNPPDLKQAATVLDAVLAVGFNGGAAHDDAVLTAAKWRIGVAQRSGDDQKAAQIYRLVQNSACKAHEKEVFLKTYAVLAGK
jgi:hypothetical protein